MLLKLLSSRLLLRFLLVSHAQRLSGHTPLGKSGDALDIAHEGSITQPGARKKLNWSSKSSIEKRDVDAAFFYPAKGHLTSRFTWSSIVADGAETARCSLSDEVLYTPSWAILTASIYA